jgi:hypothetical protein
MSLDVRRMNLTACPFHFSASAGVRDRADPEPDPAYPQSADPPAVSASAVRSGLSLRSPPPSSFFLWGYVLKYSSFAYPVPI